MLRRRILSRFFKFNINPTSLTFNYGKQKILDKENWLLENGTVVGNVTYVTKNNTHYYKLSGRGSGLENVAFLNFKTYTDNQKITIFCYDECSSPNDFLAICNLDSLDKSHLKARLNNNSEQQIDFYVDKAGSHFVKIYYYQHNDLDTTSYNIAEHGTHAGYFRLDSYYNQYEYGYDAPDNKNISIKSYTGWTLVSKPDWVSLNKIEDKAGSKSVIISVAGNPGLERSGNIVFKEKKNDTSISVSITQGENPHPNDIILSLEKSSILNEENSFTNINVTLIGNTSYVISNISSNKYTVEPSVNDQNKIIVTKTIADNTVNNVSFKITGNNGTSKLVNIVEDTISCYCDCNEHNGCNCNVNVVNDPIRILKNENQPNCDKHCESDINGCPSYQSCNGHTECYCDCNLNKPCLSECSNCKSDDSTCPTECLTDTCTCYDDTTCTHCGPHCNHSTPECPCDCNEHNKTYCKCDGEDCNCDCNNDGCNHCEGDDGCSKQKDGCGCESVGELCNCDNYDENDCQAKWVSCGTNSCKDGDLCAQCTGQICCNCPDWHCGCHNYWPNCASQDATYDYTESVHCEHCEGEKCGHDAKGYCGSDALFYCGDNGYVSCPTDCPKETCDCYSVQEEGTPCPCNNDCIPNCNTVSQCNHCEGDTCTCYDDTTCTHCGPHCKHSTSECPCDCNEHNKTYCKCEGETCDCDCKTARTCNGQDACPCNAVTNENCPKNNCESNEDTCACNQKSYHPYCQCDKYCPCQGYVIPIVS